MLVETEVPIIEFLVMKEPYISGIKPNPVRCYMHHMYSIVGMSLLMP